MLYLRTPACHNNNNNIIIMINRRPIALGRREHCVRINNIRCQKGVYYRLLVFSRAWRTYVHYNNMQAWLFFKYFQYDMLPVQKCFCHFKYLNTRYILDRKKKKITTLFFIYNIVVGTLLWVHTSSVNFIFL